jgi:hypothetical protein
MPRLVAILLDHAWNTTLVLSTSKEASLLSRDEHIPMRLVGAEQTPKIHAGALIRQDGGGFHVSFPKTPIPSIVAIRNYSSKSICQGSRHLTSVPFPRLMC